jgi:hypothetical protein
MPQPTLTFAMLEDMLLELARTAPPPKKNVIIHGDTAYLFDGVLNRSSIFFDPPKFMPEFKMPYCGERGVIMADPRNAARLTTTDGSAWPTPRHSLRGYLQRFGYRSYARVKRQRREAR